MRLEIQDIWSPDVVPPSTGLPPNLENYVLLIEVYLSEKGISGGEVFRFRVCSASALGQTESGYFIQNTLVLNQFSWQAVRDRLEKLLMHCDSCKNWGEVIQRLCGYLQYSD